MANTKFTVHHEPEDEYVTVECEWIDVYSPPELDENLMPILDKAGVDFKRVPDDLDCRTIRVSKVAIDDAIESLLNYNPNTKILTIGEWELRMIGFNGTVDTYLFRQMSTDFPRNIKVRILASEFYKPYN